MLRKKRIYQIGKKQNKSFRLPTLIVVSILALLAGLIFLSKDSSKLLIEDASSSQVQIPIETEPEISPYDLTALELPVEGQSAIGTLDFGAIKSSTADEIPVPMASITKLITVLSVMEKAPITLGEQGDEITLTAKDEQYWHDYVALQGTVTPVTAGYNMSQYEAFQAILLPSSNNIADTLVDRYFGTREEYLEFANSLIKSYGLRNTKVSDASGFSPESVSTPSDLIVIGQKILENPVLAQIVAQPNANISVAGEIPNYNPLITVPGVTGIKPGATDEAGYCLIFSADINNAAGKKETIIGVVMGIKDRPTYQSSALKLLEDSKAIITAG